MGLMIEYSIRVYFCGTRYVIKVTISYFFKTYNICILRDCEEKQTIDFVKMFTKTILVSFEIKSKNLQKSYFYHNLLDPD